MRRTFLSRAVGNAALVVLATILSLLAMEAVARMFGSGPTLGEMMLVRGTPTRSVDGVPLWDDGAPRYDADDLRRISNDDRGFKILGLGDSILYGVLLPKEETYLEQTRRLLARRSTRPVEVLNLAVPGYNTMQEDAAYKEIADAIEPDLVLVHYWQDDAHQYRVVNGYVVDLGDITEEEGRVVVRPLPLPARLSDFLLLNSRLYDLLVRFVMVQARRSVPDVWARVSKPLADIQERVKRAGGRLLVLASPGLDQESPRPNADLPRLRQLASARGIEVIDLSEWLQGVSTRQIALDGCHFNVEGQRLIAERFADYLLDRDLKVHRKDRVS
jgi:lysophospholipase L1-like esterase